MTDGFGKHRAESALRKGLKNGEIDMLPHSTAPALGMPDQGSSGGGCSAGEPQ